MDTNLDGACAEGTDAPAAHHDGLQVAIGDDSVDGGAGHSQRIGGFRDGEHRTLSHVGPLDGRVNNGLEHPARCGRGEALLQYEVEPRLGCKSNTLNPSSGVVKSSEYGWLIKASPYVSGVDLGDLQISTLARGIPLVRPEGLEPPTV